MLVAAGKPKMHMYLWRRSIMEGGAVRAQLVRRHPLRREALLAHELDG